MKKEEIISAFTPQYKTDVSGSLPCGCLKCYPNVFPNLRK